MDVLMRGVSRIGILGETIHHPCPHAHIAEPTDNGADRLEASKVRDIPSAYHFRMNCWLARCSVMDLYYFTVHDVFMSVGS